MDSIFDKINTLVNAQINEFLGRNPKSPLARIKLDASEVEENPRRTVKSLRQRLEEALAYEDEIDAKIQKITGEALALDQQADNMVQSGDEFGARRVLGQLQMKQQQLSIAEAELRDHRTLTQHLMQEMTSLELALDNQERQQSQSTSSGNQRTRIPLDDSSQDDVVDVTSVGGDKSLRNVVSNKLNETRDSLENLLNNSPVPNAPEISEEFKNFDVVDEVPDPRTPKSQQKKDDKDMGGRVSRLSKPDDD